MNDASALIGEHAVLALFVVAACLSAITALVWRLIERFGGALWRMVVQVWQSITSSAFGVWARRIPMLEASFVRTLTVWRYLGIHAVLSFVVALLAIAAFFELADEIGVDEDLALFDQRLVLALSENVAAGTMQMFAIITHLGDRELLAVIGVAVGLYLLLRRWWLHLFTWALATGLGGILVRLLKAHFERTRPIHEHTLTDSSGWSFPSGHASGAVLIYGMLGYLIVRHTPRVWHIPIALASILLIVFVGFSRVILQVHYFSDVLAGFAVASAWLALCVAGFEVVRHTMQRRRQESLS